MLSKRVVVVAFTVIVMAFFVQASKNKLHYINQTKCNQCGVCVDECPEEAIKVIKKDGKEIHVIIQEKCNQCGVCVDACPEEAISLVDSSEVKEGLKVDKKAEK